jgi:hypothetical protein
MGDTNEDMVYSSGQGVSFRGDVEKSSGWIRIDYTGKRMRLSKAIPVSESVARKFAEDRRKGIVNSSYLKRLFDENRGTLAHSGTGGRIIYVEEGDSNVPVYSPTIESVKRPRDMGDDVVDMVMNEIDGEQDALEALAAANKRE